MGTVGERLKGSVRRSEHEPEYEKDGEKDCCERQGQQQALLTGGANDTNFAIPYIVISRLYLNESQHSGKVR